MDRCLVMGIVNRTPDSFFDGGRMSLQESLGHALSLLEDGADILDLGGMKAGPGRSVSEDEETDRVVPLIAALRARTPAVLSVETWRPGVAAAAIDAGASIVNDVSGLVNREIADVCARSGASLVLMHHGGQLRGRPRNPRYIDVVGSVLEDWGRLVALAGQHGVARSALIVDPGLDFGKTTFHSLELVRRMPELLSAGLPLLVAPSRKDVVGETLNLPLEQRLEGTLALVALTVYLGAHIVRVHDVRAAARTVAMVEAVTARRPPVAPVRGLWE